MKNMIYKLLAVFLLLPSLVFADGYQSQPASAGAHGEQFLGVLSDGTVTVNSAASGTWGRYAVSAKGEFYSLLVPGSGATSLGKAEDAPAGSGDIGIAILGKILATPVAQATDADYGVPLLNDLNAMYTDPVRRGSPTATQPSVTNTTSFTCVAANAARRMLTIQNNSAANIMISLANATLTGIVPTSSNIGLVLSAGSSYTCPASYCTTAAVTCYQSSGGTINTISVVEG